MQKQKAIEMLGGTVASTAAAIGITYQAVADWPEVLSDRIADRVYAAIARRAISEEKQPQAPAEIAQAATENVAEQGV